MCRFLRGLWNDDVGVIVSVETLFLFVVLTLGLIAGWANLHAALNTELSVTANSLLALDQSFRITDSIGCNPLNVSSGSIAIDEDAVLEWQSMPTAEVQIFVDECP
ncbi:MAG: hypothetical protein K2X38_02255 [Gemmataceae bacterium]|nr:hypothetical protein [Gemmataceae bacterium]